jgi:non-homologous end joining protein Ku
MIHKPTGKRVNYTKTVGGQPVENADIVKGYPIERDTYVTFGFTRCERRRPKQK